MNAFQKLLGGAALALVLAAGLAAPAMAQKLDNKKNAPVATATAGDIDFGDDSSEWAKDGDDDPEFHPWPLDGTHRPTLCVWELGAVSHERLAWSHYLLSDRGETARREYLRDSFEGLV